MPVESVTVTEPPPPPRSLAGNYFWCWGIKVAKKNYSHLYLKKNKDKNIKEHLG